jgi:hypothetical protein
MGSSNLHPRASCWLMTSTIHAAQPPSSEDPPRRPLFDPATGRFKVGRVEGAIFIRGWSAEEFALNVECVRSVNKALAGQPVRNRTARAILAGLHRREAPVRARGEWRRS